MRFVLVCRTACALPTIYRASQRAVESHVGHFASTVGSWLRRFIAPFAYSGVRILRYPFWSQILQRSTTA